MLAMIGPDGFLRRDRHPLDGAPLAQWPEAERPRERLLRHGAEALSSAPAREASRPWDWRCSF